MNRSMKPFIVDYWYALLWAVVLSAFIDFVVICWWVSGILTVPIWESTVLACVLFLGVVVFGYCSWELVSLVRKQKPSRNTKLMVMASFLLCWFVAIVFFVYALLDDASEWKITFTVCVLAVMIPYIVLETKNVVCFAREPNNR